MITLKAGNYHTLAEIAAKYNTNRMKISRIAKKYGLGIKFGYLTLRFHDDDVKIIKAHL